MRFLDFGVSGCQREYVFQELGEGAEPEQRERRMRDDAESGMGEGKTVEGVPSAMVFRSLSAAT